MRNNLFYKVALIVFFATYSSFIMANPSVINCHNERMRKSFVIHKNQVTINIEREDYSGRSIASLSYSQRATRTKHHANGFSKIMSFEGKKYTLHIEDTKNFSELNDYISIRSKEGHEITYPLYCTLN